MLQYAGAVEGAASFHPDDVVETLEGHTYSAGMGSQTYRTCDHQCMPRPVPVVRGRPEAQQYENEYVEVRGLTREVDHRCIEEPASDCKFVAG